MALRNVMRNASDTFSLKVWPEMYGSCHYKWFKNTSWVFIFIVLIPGTIGLCRAIYRFIKNSNETITLLMPVVGVVSVIALAAISLGAARYRYPFDIWWIVLASLAFRKPDMQ